jgi:two-component system sensor histidine kinase/response regulator
MKILVIDDEASLRKVIAKALQRHGFQVSEATNGVEGLQRAKAEIPDLILSDINMEKLDGYRALEELRKEPRTSAIPFILMTGQVEPGGMRKGMDLGADDYLSKPFSIDDLVRAVQARLKHHASVREHADTQMAELRNNLSLSLPHEFITPLNAILGFSDLLRSQDRFEPDQTREMADGIHASAERLHRLIQNYLLYSQIETLRRDSARLKILREQKTESAASEIKRWAMVIAEAHGRGPDLLDSMSEGHVAMSSNYLKKSVEELVENACKFSLKGTSIRIQSITEESSYILRVSDEGRGFDPEYISWIGAYAQFDRNRHEQQGLGLGLAIVKGLTEIHGGRLRVESAPGAGTTVELALPS